jgi:type II secretory pathway pseudopilin PulG
MKFVLEFVASLCTALFAGASLYINLVEHPARMECGTALAAVEFGPSYRRATVMQASLAVAAFLTGTWAWWLNSIGAWLVGGILIGAVVPFTLIAILPTNKKLLDPLLDRNSELARTLLKKWGRLHAVRTVLSVVALVIFLAGMAAANVRQEREAKLREDLFVLRQVVSQYTLDKQRAPQTLHDLVESGYLKSIPVDPFTGRADWVLEAEPEIQDPALPSMGPGIIDVHSASNLADTDGTAYSTW